jgi:hypothetical protein
MPRFQLPRPRCQKFEALHRRCHVCKILNGTRPARREIRPSAIEREKISEREREVGIGMERYFPFFYLFSFLRKFVDILNQDF